jgi:hypothetical protein
MTTSFSGGGSRSTRREPPTMGKQLLDLSNAFLVEYLLTAISSMPDISTSVLKQFFFIKLTCVAVTK